jgi:hypothetical protein
MNIKHRFTVFILIGVCGGILGLALVVYNRRAADVSRHEFPVVQTVVTRGEIKKDLTGVKSEEHIALEWLRTLSRPEGFVSARSVGGLGRDKDSSRRDGRDQEAMWGLAEVPADDLSRLKLISFAYRLHENSDLEYLKYFSGLEGLEFGESVSDEGLKHLGSLKAPLKEVVFWNSPLVTDAALVHFENFKTLELLDLRGTTVTAAAVKKLRIALPKCIIASPSEPDEIYKVWDKRDAEVAAAMAAELRKLRELREKLKDE